MPQLRAVSDDWLAAKASAEKGFSLGFFDEAYVSRFPVAVIEHGDRILAFANIWAGPGTVELSIDLMRHHRDAPKNVMEALFVHLMTWGKEQGYQWFGLGMAPMAGFETSPVASAVESARRVHLCSTAMPSTVSRDCARTKTSSTRSGSRTTWRIRVVCASRASWLTSRRSWPVAI